MLLPLILGVLVGAEPELPRFTFEDRAEHDGRSVLHFRALELGKEPPRPIERVPIVGSGARYGVVSLGSDPARVVLWEPDAPGGPRLWFDADGDGRLTEEERHALTGEGLTVRVAFTVGAGEKAQQLVRTLVFRRSAVGDGVRYAVRGYAVGSLDLGGTSYRALLTDGDADGCLNTPGADRLWIDLDRDGRFDPVTEQFLLGTPIRHGGRTYLVRPDAAGSAVRVQLRPQEAGTLRLRLGPHRGRAIERFSAQLVSDFGELVTVGAEGEALAVPAGRYRVEALSVRLTDARGRRWSYRFAGGGRGVRVDPGKETSADALDRVTLAVGLRGPAGGVSPGGTVAVTPRLSTPAGLYLADCTVQEAGEGQPTSWYASIGLLDAQGGVVDQARSGFL
jgi:hypothetical protein